jgi:predicted DNA-binding transcriptional regulator YafY
MLSVTVANITRQDQYLEFIQLLLDHPAGGGAQRLADQLGVDRRSVYRYRDKALKHGLTLDDEPGVLRLRSQDRDAWQRDLTLDTLEIQLLLAATSGRQAHSPALRRVLDKLRAAQGEHGQRAFGATPFLHLAQQDELPDGLFDRLAHAITAHKTVQLTYLNSKRETRQYAFDPYGLVQRGDHLYLVGANHNSCAAGFAGVQSLRMDSVQVCTLSRQNFARPDFDLRAYVQTSFGAYAGVGAPVVVRLQVSPEKAHTLAPPQPALHRSTGWQPVVRAYGAAEPGPGGLGGRLWRPPAGVGPTRAARAGVDPRTGGTG